MRTFLSLYAKTSIMLVSVLAAVIGGEAVATFYLGAASRYHFVLMLSLEAMIALFLYRTFTCTKYSWVDMASMGNVMFWVVLLVYRTVGK